ncbi:MAG: hypothetical protein MJB57_14410 [Gemmatimonadetes bacterium]|nr:hypothetical protein [Gemmatimonadota bacterium]
MAGAHPADASSQPLAPPAPPLPPIESRGEASEPVFDGRTDEAREVPASPVAEPRGPSHEAPVLGMHAEVTTPSDPAAELEAAGITRLRDEASQAARRDAEAGVPDENAEGQTQRESDLRDRCRAFYDRWSNQYRRQVGDQVADSEEAITDRIGRADLAVDRFERLTNELMRVKARRTVRHREVTTDLKGESRGQRGLSTQIYLIAISFLGVVEFFANAPVFTALLPRDVLTERQIRLVTETSDGWFAGAERVFAQLILRPDAALLALGVVTFLCVLAHFFGHSLRELVMLQDNEERHHTVAARSRTENVIPMALTGLGLLLVLGVLYEARIRLGEVGETQYTTDTRQVEEWRREAALLVSDGDLLQANALRAQAADLEAAATNLRDYADSMSRLSFPILLLNLTLVICAICAAYFHRRDHRRQHFNDNPFERDRLGIIESAEETAEEISGHLSDLARRIRKLQGFMSFSGLEERRGVVRELESVVALYRAENGRARGLDPRAIAAFRRPIALDIEIKEDARELAEPLRSPREYDEERRDLQERFQIARKRFNEEAIAW